MATPTIASMDNLTHSLVGLTAAKAGLERLSPGATTLCVLAANAPDSDIVAVAFGDRWTFLEHHRGITHSIAGVIFLAVLLPLIFYGVDWIWSRFRNQTPKTKFKGLLIASFIASATHPLLDWSNNYGIRFLLPWSAKWFYGDLLFIVDPYIWLILGGAAFLLTARTGFLKTIWALVAAVLTFLIVASSRSGSLPNPRLMAVFWVVALIILIVLSSKGVRERWGRRIAFVAIALVCCYWTFLAFAHSRALAEASLEATTIANSNGERVTRLAAMPRLANPFSWDCVFQTDRADYRFELALLGDNKVSPPVRYEKPSASLVVHVILQRPGRVFLGFARFPVMQPADLNCATSTLVQIADLRYTEPGRSRGTFSLELPIDCASGR